MKKMRLISIFIMVLFCATFQSDAEVLEYKTLDRDYEPMQMKAAPFADTGSTAKFRNVAFSEIFAFAYHADTGEWVEIPLQIDELNAYGYLFDPATRDSRLFEPDELAVMAHDLGDRVSENEWLDDPDASTYQRYEVAVVDPLTGGKGWFYLYRSTTLQSTQTTDYVSRTVNDIYTDIYTIGHNSQLIMDHLSFPSIRGTRGVRVIDRQKARLVGTAKYSVFTIDYNKTEADLLKKSVYYVDGPVRILQQVNWIIEITVYGTTIEIPATLNKRFYQYSAEVVGGQGDLPADMGTKLVRSSIDIHSNFSGSKFYNPYNAGLTLNRWADQVVDKQVDIPGVFWALVTKNSGTVQGSFLQLMYMSNAIGDRQRLYYCERSSGTDDYDSRYDHINIGTSDTGEDASWGDIGLHLLGNVQGDLQLATNMFFFKNPIDSATGAQVADNFGAGMSAETELQTIDVTAPSQIVLLFEDAADNALTWRWVAPGDDENQGGPAQLYEMRYAETAPGFAIESWWNAATAVTNLPAPADPNQMQSVEVTGLDREKTYYFLMRSKDDAGNYSSFSPVASRATTPVELVAFEAEAQADFVSLTWQTASESNNYGFEIQRRESDQDYVQIGFVTGAGTSDEPQMYSFIDTDIYPAEFEYRLKQIDTDGQFVYSQPTFAAVEGPRAFALHQNYPNPFNAETTFKYEVPRLQQGEQVEAQFDVSLTVYNLLGQKVRTLVNELKTSNLYSVRWDSRDDDGQHVSSGVYLVHFTARSLNGGGQVYSSLKKMILLP